MMLFADLRHFCQLIRSPGTACGIVRIAENKQLRIIVSCLLFEVFKIHGIVPVAVDQLAVHYGSVGV